jgi:hypothetical protein
MTTDARIRRCLTEYKYHFGGLFNSMGKGLEISPDWSLYGYCALKIGVKNQEGARYILAGTLCDIALVYTDNSRDNYDYSDSDADDPCRLRSSNVHLIHRIDSGTSSVAELKKALLTQLKRRDQDEKTAESLAISLACLADVDIACLNEDPFYQNAHTIDTSVSGDGDEEEVFYENK